MIRPHSLEDLQNENHDCGGRHSPVPVAGVRLCRRYPPVRKTGNAPLAMGRARPGSMATQCNTNRMRCRRLKGPAGRGPGAAFSSAASVARESPEHAQLDDIAGQVDDHAEQFVVRQETLQVQPSNVYREVLTDLRRAYRVLLKVLFQPRFYIIVGRKVDATIEFSRSSLSILIRAADDLSRFQIKVVLLGSASLGRTIRNSKTDGRSNRSPPVRFDAARDRRR